MDSSIEPASVSIEPSSTDVKGEKAPPGSVDKSLTRELRYAAKEGANSRQTRIHSKKPKRVAVFLGLSFERESDMVSGK